MILRTYDDVSRLQTFMERFDYLKLVGVVGTSTFGFDRYLNQGLYRSTEWRRVRDAVILRDDGCDLGHFDYQIHDRVIVHHMNPITVEDIEARDPKVLDPRFLICTSHSTHLAIHFGNSSNLRSDPIDRRSGDTTLWH